MATTLTAALLDFTTAAGRTLMEFAGQIPFPATQSASADPNTLDDYEEGTFSPTFTAATPPTGVTYSNQIGRYTKIGRLVMIEGRLSITSKGTGGSGIGMLGGLPFAAALICFTNQLRFGGVTLPASTILGALVNGSSLLFQYVHYTGANDVNWADFSDTFDVIFTASYSV